MKQINTKSNYFSNEIENIQFRVFKRDILKYF